MERVYRKQRSERLGREMELLVFGRGGQPVVVFPTSGGRFYEFEDQGMVETVRDRVEAGRVELWCVDSINGESWYNRKLAPRERVARQVAYEKYVLEEVVPRMRAGIGAGDGAGRLAALGCSFGGYQAVNMALRHPEVFGKTVSLSGAFDLTMFLDGYYDEECYFNLPLHYLPNLTDAWYLERYRRNYMTLATGWDDQCLTQNQELDGILREKGIPHQLDVWEEKNSHDWPSWRRMVAKYL
jgi:esterase/lipase superfamily enzyme